MSVIDPRTIYCAVPCYSGQNMAELTGMLFAAGRMLGALSMPTECSDVSLVRNLIAANFLATELEWLVCIDSDTVPCGLRDLQLLLEPCDTRAKYVEGDSLEPGDPRPSRVITALSADPFQLDSKTQGAADLLVCAEYVYKNDNLEPCRFGLGFTRIHRSVFERLMELKHEAGPTVEVQRHVLDKLKAVYESNAHPGPEDRAADFTRVVEELLATVEDKAGQPRLWQAIYKGRTFYDFYPHGAALSMMVPGAPWKGEDHGFFMLCQLAGIIPRVETRTRLLHIGRKAYPYLGPEVGGGQ